MPIAYNTTMLKCDPFAGNAMRKHAVHLPASLHTDHVQITPLIPLERGPLMAIGTSTVDLSVDGGATTDTVHWKNTLLNEELFVPIFNVVACLNMSDKNVGRMLLGALSLLPRGQPSDKGCPHGLLMKVQTEPVSVKHLAMCDDYPPATTQRWRSVLHTSTVTTSVLEDDVNHKQHTPVSLLLVTLATARHLIQEVGWASAVVPNPYTEVWVSSLYMQMAGYQALAAQSKDGAHEWMVSCMKNVVHTCMNTVSSKTLPLSEKLNVVRKEVFILLDAAWKVALIMTGFGYMVVVPDINPSSYVVQALSHAVSAIERRGALRHLHRILDVRSHSPFDKILQTIVDTAGVGYPGNMTLGIIWAYHEWFASTAAPLKVKQHKHNFVEEDCPMSPLSTPATKFVTAQQANRPHKRVFDATPLFQRYNENISYNLSAAAQYWSALERYVAWNGNGGCVPVDTVLSIQCCTDFKSQISVLTTASDSARLHHAQFRSALWAACGTLQTTMRDACHSMMFLSRSKCRGVLPFSRLFLLNGECRTIEMLVYFASMLTMHLDFSFQCAMDFQNDTQFCHRIVKSQLQHIKNLATLHITNGLLPCADMSNIYNWLLPSC